jgi:hypothetical protein
MDQRLAMLGWILLAGGGAGLLGGLFGAVAGSVHWRNGNATGTRLGLSVAGAFDRVARREMSPGVKGAVVGGIDGLAFLGTVGVVVAALVLYNGGSGRGVLLPLLLGLLSLMGGALLFGTLAWGILRAGVWAVVAVFAGGMTGAFFGALTGGAGGLLAGCVLGAILGNVAALLTQRWAPAFQPLQMPERLRANPPHAGPGDPHITNDPDLPPETFREP